MRAEATTKSPGLVPHARGIRRNRKPCVQKAQCSAPTSGRPADDADGGREAGARPFPRRLRTIASPRPMARRALGACRVRSSRFPCSRSTAVQRAQSLEDPSRGGGGLGRVPALPHGRSLRARARKGCQSLRVSERDRETTALATAHQLFTTVPKPPQSFDLFPGCLEVVQPARTPSAQDHTRQC